MSLYIASLNSGSNGNCYYIGNKQEAVLIDAGISCRETEKRMKRLGLSMELVKAVFISHEHSDHIRGIEVLCKKYDLPVYITPGTYLHGRLSIDDRLVRNFNGQQTIAIGALSITSFPKFHDAAEPHSFVVSANGITIGIFTDIGAPCENLIRYFKQCHAAFLEANYDVDMLEQGRYPYHLKRRIRGGHGHLSNAQALEVFKMHKPHFMSHVLLAHLSQDNNRPELVQSLFEEHAGDTTVVVASRHQETPVFQISGTVQQYVPVSVYSAATAVQYSLF
jgi:phosphoribosyl 1,2-cyclic phosphodiesterase